LIESGRAAFSPIAHKSLMALITGWSIVPAGE
jgi:hypothetical protein